jgi:hypothetical protein
MTGVQFLFHFLVLEYNSYVLSNFIFKNCQRSPGSYIYIYIYITQSPFVPWLSRRAQSGRRTSLGRRVWFIETHTPPPPPPAVLDKSLARPRRKQATATEDFDFHISYL